MKPLSWWLVFFMTAAGTGAWAQALDGTFTSLSGQVMVKNSKGGVRMALIGSRVLGNETVVTSNGATATLKMFDDSVLEMKASTELKLSTLQKPSEKEKILRFSLGFGGLRAIVAKLITPSSLFEVEAGGVICGVRGTEFFMDYQKELDKLDLRVAKGFVYAKAGGQTYLYHAGEEMEFRRGLPLSSHGEGEPMTRGTKKTGGRPEKPQVFSASLGDLDQQFLGTFNFGTGSPASSAPGGMAGGGLNSLGAIGIGLANNITLPGVGVLPLRLLH